MAQINKLKLLANVIYKMPTMRYLAYIRSKKWEARRREYLESMDYVCEIDNINRACQVHHWTYANLGNEPDYDLCAVCVRCHHKLHRLVMPPAANDNIKQYELFTKEVV